MPLCYFHVKHGVEVLTGSHLGRKKLMGLDTWDIKTPEYSSCLFKSRKAAAMCTALLRGRCSSRRLGRQSPHLSERSAAMRCSQHANSLGMLKCTALSNISRYASFCNPCSGHTWFNAL